jgi:hypothetical protein
MHCEHRKTIEDKCEEGTVLLICVQCGLRIDSRPEKGKTGEFKRPEPEFLEQVEIKRASNQVLQFLCAKHAEGAPADVPECTTGVGRAGLCANASWNGGPLIDGSCHCWSCHADPGFVNRPRDKSTVST